MIDPVDVSNMHTALVLQPATIDSDSFNAIDVTLNSQIEVTFIAETTYLVVLSKVNSFNKSPLMLYERINLPIATYTLSLPLIS